MNMNYYIISLRILILREYINFIRLNNDIIENWISSHIYNNIINNILNNIFDEMFNEQHEEKTVLTQEEYNKLIQTLKEKECKEEKECVRECNVCKEDILENIIILNCKHTYHNNCLFKWLTEYNISCCVCRDDVRKYI